MAVRTGLRSACGKGVRPCLSMPAFWLMSVALLAGLAGCASVEERQAFLNLKIEAGAFAGEADASAAGMIPELGEDATLSDYTAYALLRNPGLEAAFNDWKAGLERVSQARSLPDPRFTYVHYVEAVETRVGPQERSFALMQTFPWLGKLQRQGDIAFKEAEAARQRYEAARLRLIYQLKLAYYEYYYLWRAISVMETDIKLVSNLEGIARTKYEVGTVPYSTLIKAQVEMGKLEETLATLMDLEDPTVARLNKTLGRPPDAYLARPTSLDTEPITSSDDDILAELKRNNPELLALDLIVSKEEASIGLVRQGYFPDITLGATVVRTGDALNPQLEDSGKDPVMATVSLNLPIWIGKHRAAGREARARLHATAKRREDHENQLLSDLKLALFGFRSAERKIDLYGDSLIPKAEQALTASRKAFSADKADFFDLIEAQRTLLEFQLAHERALADRAERLAEIEMLIGRQVRPEQSVGPGVGMDSPAPPEAESEPE
ncbi:MAG: TolC family protein [Candidatus Eisenbacteria bacterium]